MRTELERRLDRAQVVSLDVFDTAVLRKLDEPESLFHLMLPRISAILGARASEFPATRRFAEYEARGRIWEKEKTFETSLAEIYAVVAEILGLEETAIAELCRREIDAELAICCQNPFVYSIYRRAVDSGKRVVFLSDMYLPPDVVGEILNKCGYIKYDALLVSSETRKTKAAGTLYDEALARIGIEAKHWLHIGDNLHSDVKVARKRGIPSWHYLSHAQKFAQDRRQYEAWRPNGPLPPAGYVVKGLIANRLTRTKPLGDSSKPGESFWEDFGYAAAGPVYAGFTEWLVEQVAKRELDAIYFLSRDGYVIQRLFGMLRPPELAKIDTHYLYASRRALRVATIQTIDTPTLDFLIESFDPNEVGVFLQRLGLDPQALEADIKRAGFGDAHQLVTTGKDFERLQQLITSLSEPICERARSERAVILEYLRKSGLTNGRRVALVDVGWRGYQQSSIQEILHADGELVDITGFYFGTFMVARKLHDSRFRHEAYLFKFGLPREYEAQALNCIEINELLFSAPEGSLVRMERKASGDIVPVLQPADARDAARHSNVEKLQAGAMQFVADYLALKQEFPDLVISAEIATNQLRRVLRDPTYQEASHLGDIQHTKDFGDSTPRPIAQRLSLSALLSRRKLIRWNVGPWRAGVRARSSRLANLLYRLRMRDMA